MCVCINCLSSIFSSSFFAESMDITAGKDEERTFYDQEYFDSESDEEETSTDKQKKQHPVISNDDLLYDPMADAEDQAWVDRQWNRRRGNKPGKQTAAGGGAKGQTMSSRKPPSSDAVLDCPACMTTLCVDCQR